MSLPLLLIGAGGLGRETAQTALAAGHEVLGYLDDDVTRRGVLLDDIPVLGGLEVVTQHPDACLVLCLGKGTARQAVAMRLAGWGVGENRYISVVHPSAYVPDTCTVDVGSVLLAGVVLTTSVHVGRHVVVMPNATLTHDDVLDDFSTVCAGVQLGGSVRIGRAAYLGMGSSVREGVTVGQEAVLGMGAVVLRDIPAGQTWIGVPAVPLSLHPTTR